MGFDLTTQSSSLLGGRRIVSFFVNYKLYLNTFSCLLQLYKSCQEPYDFGIYNYNASVVVG
jgi:hypothetical protein